MEYNVSAKKWNLLGSVEMLLWLYLFWYVTRHDPVPIDRISPILIEYPVLLEKKSLYEYSFILTWNFLLNLDWHVLIRLKVFLHAQDH